MSVLGPEFPGSQRLAVSCVKNSDHQIIQPTTIKTPGVSDDERKLKSSGHGAQDHEQITDSGDNGRVVTIDINSIDVPTITREKQLAPSPPEEDDDDVVSAINQTGSPKLTSTLAEDSENSAENENPQSSTSTTGTTITATTSTSNTSTTSTTSEIESVKSELNSERRGARCFSCGSLYSSTNSDCEVFNKTDAVQQVTCQLGEACLFYAWKASDTKTSIIRECFSKSILLGSQASPVEITESCEPRSVDSGGSIWACICTEDLCNDLQDYQLSAPDKDNDTALSDPPQNHEEVIDKAVKIESETTTAAVAISTSTAKPKFNKIICHQCGSLFSGKNSDCSVFDKNNKTQQGFCEPGEACLWYSWQKTKEYHKTDT